MGRNECFVSAASAWEISIKHSRGSLELPDKPEVYFPDRLSRFGFKPLAVQIHHALRVSSLPAHHKDPFDRLLVAQCQVEGIPLITADTQIRMYDAEVIW